MGKFKKNKKGKSDAVYTKKSVSTAKENPFANVKPATAMGTIKKINPFEMHVNKEKFNILGRVCKHDKGLPGVSRGKAIKKRKETLGVEYRNKNKTNKFQDRRIGRHLTDDQLTEEVLNARFLADKVGHDKKNKNSKFNLNDDEILTHRGQTLEEIEQFHDERSDDDTEDEALNADFTETANFGGDEQSSKDRKTAIEEMIVEQKKRKLEILKEKDEVHELTQKLDNNYKELFGLMGKMTKKEAKAKPEPDDFDRIMRELIFEPRGTVSDKLISEEEMAKREKERFQKLETERLNRMRPDEEIEEENLKKKHRSADDVDEGYYKVEDVVDDETLTYNFEGKTIMGATKNQEDAELKDDDKDSLAAVDDGDEEESDSEDEQEEAVGGEENSDSNDENENEEVSDDASDAGGNSDEENVNDKDKEDADDNDDDDDDDADDDGKDKKNQDGDEDEDEDDEEDNFSDLKTSDEESEDDTQNEIETKKVIKTQSKGKKTGSTEPFAESARNLLQQNIDLPFIIEMPESYKEFIVILKNHTPKDQSSLIDRLIKFNHPKLDGVNSENVVKLFTFILQYINELFSDATEADVRSSFRIFKELQKPLYDLLKLNSEKMSRLFLNNIVEKHKKYRKKPKMYPGVDTLVFLMLVPKLYSTSDYYHPIVTPCYMFMEHILSTARVRSRQDIAMGLFIITCVLKYSQQSKRFLPAAFNFLLGVIYLCIPKRPIETLKIQAPFCNQGPFSKLLAIGENVEHITTDEEKIKCEDLVMTTIPTEFKVRALNITLKMTKDAIVNIQDNVGSNYLAMPFIPIMERLTMELYPSFVRESFEATLVKLKEIANKSLKQLVQPAQKPKALRLLEPRFEAVYDDKRRPKLSAEKEKQAKLLHKVKRETKGAIREIRRDTEFLQKMRIEQQIQSDKERKEKVKRIYQEASVQQGELNKMAREKKKKM